MPKSSFESTDSSPHVEQKRSIPADQTLWRRPAGVSSGTWRYAHEGSIAARYNDFVADTPLCRVDLQLLAEVFPQYEADANRCDSVQTAAAAGAVAPHVEPGSPHQKKIAAAAKWVLDLGCGTGRASELLAAAGFEVMAIDLSIPMLQQVQQRGLKSVLPIHANLVELDCIGDDVASGAVCLFSTLGMIQGRSNRRRFLSHVRRIVQSGGLFYLHVHHRYAALTSLPGTRQLAGSAMRAMVQPQWEFGDAVYPYRGLPDMFLHQFSRRELRADFAASGWQVQRWERLSLDGSRLLGNKERAIAGGFLVVVN